MAIVVTAGERHVGLIGYGAIGRELARALLADKAHRYRISLLTRSAGADPNGADDRLARVKDFLLLAPRPVVIIEAAGQQAVAEEVPRLLEAGIPVILASIGALADDVLRARLERIAEEHHASLILPPGAVGGLDYLRAAALTRPVEVRYTSRKPPAAWRDELAAKGLSDESVIDELVLFEGPARQAAALFPKNLNVAATLAVAGIGMDETRVRVVVDPRVSANSHEVDISSPLGRACFTFVNTPSPDNPKTSRIAAFSLYSAVRQFFGR